MKNAFRNANSKFHIGLDLDGVVFDQITAMSLVAVENGLPAFTAEDIYMPQIDQIYNYTAEQTKAVFDNPRAYELMQPIAGATDTIGMWRRWARVFLITSRPHELVGEVTVASLGKYGITHDGLEFCKGHEKGRICAKKGIDVYIEDILKNANDIARYIPDVLLLDYPWNQGELAPNVVRVTSWESIRVHISSCWLRKTRQSRLSVIQGG